MWLRKFGENFCVFIFSNYLQGKHWAEIDFWLIDCRLLKTRNVAGMFGTLLLFRLIIAGVGFGFDIKLAEPEEWMIAKVTGGPPPQQKSQ